MRNKAEKTTLPNWTTKRFCVGLPPAVLGGQISVISSQVSRIPRPRSLFMFARVAADASGAFALFARTLPALTALPQWHPESDLCFLVKVIFICPCRGGSRRQPSAFTCHRAIGLCGPAVDLIEIQFNSCRASGESRGWARWPILCFCLHQENN